VGAEAPARADQEIRGTPAEAPGQPITGASEMNIYQDSHSLLWVKEVKLNGRWYRAGAFDTYPEAGLAPINLFDLVRIDGPTR
jgi:hypothetical protein